MNTEAVPMSDTPEGEVATPAAQSPDAGTPTPAPARRRRWRSALPWVVAVLALAAAGYSTWQWRQLAGHQQDVDSARTAAVAFTQELTNWDAGDGLDDEVDALRERGTGPFLDEIDLVFGGDELTSQLEADGVTATGEVQEAFVQDLEDGVAEVFTVVEVTYGATELERDPEPVTFPASLVMERGDDGEWLVREVTIPNSSQIGQLMAPTSGA